MATLVYSDADGIDRSFALGGDPVIVGRGPECAIQSKDPRVSRQHARFFVDQGALWVEDLGSSNGIYVGPNKVQRAPVPTGEIILVGSLVIRLLPASGTLPPPNGLHGTLATWLDLERKARAAVEEERDAFARRVGEMHQQVAALKEVMPPSTTMRDGSGSPFDIGGDTTSGVAAEAVRLRDEAEAQVARLEQALAAMQDELEMLRRAAGAEDGGADLVRLREELAAARARIVAFELEGSTKVEWSTGQVEQKLTALQNTLEEEQSARSRAEHVAAEAQRDSMSLRQELDELRRTSAAEIEIARLDVQKTKEHKNLGETIAGTVAAERLAESDMVIAGLQRDLQQARGQHNGPELRVRELQELNTVLMGRAEKAEKELSAAQIRAQGAERNLAHANTQATKAEARASHVETRLQDAEDKAKAAEAELAQIRDKQAAAASQAENLVTLDTRGNDAELAAAEAKLTKLVVELEAQKTRVAELELAAGERVEQLREADTRVTTAKTEAGMAIAKLAEAEQRAASLQARVEQLGRADSVIEAASKAKQDATERAADADKRISDAERRSDDAEKRASAADTMAKAMAKDVAEALRRAAEADMRARSVARELVDAKTRAESAEAVRETASGALAGVEQRAVDAETELARVREEFPGKLAAAEAELKKKLEASQRELAAERSTALTMVDRKTHLERDLADVREKLPATIARADEAEKKLAEAEIQIEMLQDRVLDLESGMAVSETAQQASLADAREEIKSLKVQLAEATTGVRKLSERVAELEDLLQDSERALAMVDGALREAKNQLADLERAAQARGDSEAAYQERLEDALARAGEAEARIEQLAVKAEASDLAIGRASALQRQLDEAISKLAWTERQGRGDPAADAKLRDAEARLKDAEGRVQTAEARIADAERRTQVAQAKQQELVDQVAKLERRAQEPARDPEVERQLAAAQERVSSLEREVAAADNVRSFAAVTEREIAALQRVLREARSKLTQITLERDRLAIEVRDARINDDETTGRRTAIKEAVKPEHDPDATGVLDVSRMEGIITRASEAEHKLIQTERDVAALRARLAETEERLRAAIDRPDEEDSEATRTGSQLPIVLGEHVNILEESIDSLRANMRAASDETAIMDQTDSVIAVASAVSQAAEHIERARAAIRALAAAIGMVS